MNFTRNFYTMPKTSTVRKNTAHTRQKTRQTASKERYRAQQDTHVGSTRTLGVGNQNASTWKVIGTNGQVFYFTEWAYIPQYCPNEHGNCQEYYSSTVLSDVVHQRSKAFASNVEWSDKDCQDEYERPESDYY